MKGRSKGHVVPYAYLGAKVSELYFANVDFWKCKVQYSAHIDKVVVVKVSVCMQFMCEMMHVSVGQELGERVKHTKRLHLQLTIAIY